MPMTGPSFKATTAGHSASAHGSAILRTRLRTPLSWVSVALTLGMLISPTRSQSSGVLAGDQPVTDSGERRLIPRDPMLGIVPNETNPSASRQPRLRPWWAWPGISGETARDGWMTEGLPSSGVNGDRCWPHGDHFHCR
jgi:hypothetical protein